MKGALKKHYWTSKITYVKISCPGILIEKGFEPLGSQRLNCCCYNMKKVQFFIMYIVI